jgi:hypothetical protein
MAGNHPRCDEFVGLPVAEVSLRVSRFNLRIVDVEEEEAAAAAGIRRVFHSDYRRDRVNILVQDGIVRAAAKF